MPAKKKPSIDLENVGPIEKFHLQFKGPGITVLNAPNGSGKSIALNAVQAAAAGKGQAPLRDQTRRGKVEAFGAKITIASNCRHTGEFEAENLEGRFDIGKLIDPKIKSPESADAQRIKALVSLTGVKADPALFKSHEAFEDYETVVTEASTETDDLVEMARRIKRDYDNKAREQEAVADREDGHVAALDPDPELDISKESDAEILREQYNDARDLVSKISSQRESYLELKESADEARDSLDNAEAAPDTEDIKSRLESMEERSSAIISEVVALNEKIKELDSEYDRVKEKIDSDKELLASAESLVKNRASLEKLVARFEEASCPTSEEMANAKQALEDSKEAMETGTLVREALKSQDKAAEHRKSAADARNKADKYRDAGKAVDDVLSGVIECDELRIESDGKAARLVTKTDRGDRTSYHDLSDGERGRIAIDIAAKSVGEGGIVVVDQLVWEGLDADNRDILHTHAVKRDVYILTAEASQEHNAPKEINGRHWGDSE